MAAPPMRLLSQALRALRARYTSLSSSGLSGMRSGKVPYGPMKDNWINGWEPCMIDTPTPRVRDVPRLPARGAMFDLITWKDSHAAVPRSG